MADGQTVSEGTVDAAVDKSDGAPGHMSTRVDAHVDMCMDAAANMAADMPADATAAKQALRRAALARRRLTTPDERRAAGIALASAAQRAGLCDGRSGSPTVAAYVSMGTEIDMAPLLQAFLDAGWRVLVPRLGRGLDVGWSALPSLGALESMGERRPGEPVRSASFGADALRAAQLIIVPALAVDAWGTRLGRGGGWYDRALRHRSPASRIVAVCWPWETLGAGVGALPREAHDLPVDAVLTPEGCAATGAAPDRSGSMPCLRHD